MKKTVLCILFVAVYIAVRAQTPQIEKGTGMVSVDVPFYIDGYKHSGGAQNGGATFEFRPSVSGGAFVHRNLMLGAGFGVYTGWNFYKTEVWMVQNSRALAFTPSLMLRYYHLFTPKVGIYGQFLAEGRLEMGGAFARHGVALLLSPRVVVFPKPNLGINVGMGEMGYEYAHLSSSAVHQFLLIPSLHVGASFFIRKK